MSRDPFAAKGNPSGKRVIKLIASVSGGVLESIHVDSDLEFDVEVFDWDNIDAADIGEDDDPQDHIDAETNRFNALTKDLKDII